MSTQYVLFISIRPLFWRSKSVAFLYEIVHLKKNLLIADVIIQGTSLKNYINIYLVMDKLDSFSACCNILIAFKKIVFSSFWQRTPFGMPHTCTSNLWLGCSMTCKGLDDNERLLECNRICGLAVQ